MEVTNLEENSSPAANTDSASVEDTNLAPSGEEGYIPEGGIPIEEGAEPLPEGKDQKPVPGAVKELIHTRKRAQEAERMAAYWQGVAQGKGGTPEQVVHEQATVRQDVEPIAPLPSDYEGGIYDPEYIADHDKYLIEAAEFRVERKQRAISEQEKVKGVHETFMSRMKEAAALDPEFDQMFEDPTFFPHSVKIAGDIVAVIKESDYAPQILKELYHDKDAQKRLYGMNIIQAAREIGKLEAKVMIKPKAEPPRRISQAPEPINKVGSSSPSPIVDDEDDLPMTEFMKRRNKKQYGRA